ncbi:MAG TPA: hypothetical protein VFK09_10280 [Gemmatimonadales bacterium]|jgi:hypothetical protein|nr:hypothetical protein [Gemmatimonadales bacterium]
MPTHRPPRKVVVTLLAALVAAGCSDSTGPAPTRPQADLNILQLGSAAPPLVAASVTFQACRGESAEGRLLFQNASGGEGEEFARLKLDGSTLFARPDGTRIADGECVDITMGVSDPASRQMLIQLEPTGLAFNPARPAELRLDYGEAEGVDSDVERRIGIWRQERPTDPFTLIGSAVLKDAKEVEARLMGFSRYALAY